MINQAEMKRAMGQNIQADDKGIVKNYESSR